ncbi:MAG: hypothetical protein Q4B42_00920 [Oscillospiraceae bacterium]|nr:hypothetical protein [Oscillospiraceae bacterium]
MTNKELVLETIKRLGKAEALSLREKAVSGQADGTALIAEEAYVPEWTQRDYTAIPLGAPYQYQGQVYTLTQQHDATGQPDWRPGVAYSLWDLKHTKDPTAAKPYVAPQGSWGLYDKGDCMIWTDGHVWKSKIDNNAYTPESYAQGWEIAV